ncbi:MAG: hypothetical protein ILM98_07725 [Kiritimatiellae bacterium]|nr:hypothetical protein [Kiritimatiellia bacterium]
MKRSFFSCILVFAAAGRVFSLGDDGLIGRQETVGEYAYFTKAALETADMAGVAGDIDSILGRCADELSAAEALAAHRIGHERDAILSRVEIARHLESYIRRRHTPDESAKDSELLAWQGAMEMRSLFAYFTAERQRGETLAKLPAAEVLDIRDFGAKGDGAADDGPAIRRALAAAKELAPAPVTVMVPAGVFLVHPDGAKAPETTVFRNFRDYGEDGRPVFEARERPWKDFGAGFHITCHGFSNLTVRGEPGAEIRFADATRGGFGFWGCTETVVKDIAISYRDNPSTQGTIVSTEKDPVSFVFRRDEGYPDPDERRFTDAHSNRFTVHEGDGQLFARGGTGRMGTVERLSGDTFRFRPFKNMEKNPYWLERKAGERISVIARYSENAKGHPIFMQLCSFSGAEGVTVFDSPGQSFIFGACTAMRLVGCVVKVRPGSDDLVSSNADGYMGPGMIGPYIAGCRFESMEDDGINVGTEIATLESISEDGLSFAPSLFWDGAFRVDGVTGVVKGFMRFDADGRLRTAIGADAVSSASLGEGARDMKAWLRSNSWVGKQGEAKPDRLIRIPGTAGAVVKDTSFFNLRGMGIQVHCANMLVENVEVRHATGPGMNVNPLFGWGMVFNVHNVIVRNCRFIDTANGIVVKPGCVQPGVEPKQKMIQGIRIVGNSFDLAEGGSEVIVDNAFDVEIQRKQNGE